MATPLTLTAPDGRAIARTYVHRMLNYRYHWHRREYELCLLLQGRAVYNRGEEVWALTPGDLLLSDPGCAHASCAQQPDTLALVLRFSADTLPLSAKPGRCVSLGRCAVTAARPHPATPQLRHCAAGLITELARNDRFSAGAARAWFALLTAELCRQFAGPSILCATEQETAAGGAERVTEYLRLHYAEKITLDDLADFTGYNRTYLSTFFKVHTGTNFHEYLTRVRFQHAVYDLTYTQKTLTQVALDNGFPELKLFNQRFRAAFEQSPAQYRARLAPELLAPPDLNRRYCDPLGPEVAPLLQQWLARA